MKKQIWISVCGLVAGLLAAQPGFSKGDASPVLPSSAGTNASSLVSLPLDLAAVRENWTLTEATNVFNLALVEDELLGRKVFEIKRNWASKQKYTAFSFKSKTPVSGAYVVEAWVRFPLPELNAKGVLQTKPGIKAVLSCGALSGVASNPPPAYVLQAGTGAESFSWSGKCGTNATVAGGLSPFLKIADVSPLALESFRLEMEAGLAAMPAPLKTWIPLRMEVGPARVRLYYNGALVLDGPPVESADGPVELSIRGDARVACLTVRPVDPTPSAFVQVPLDFRLNAAGPVDLAGLSPSRDPVLVHGIPFQLASGASSNDHVDVGASVFRYRFATRYAAEIDPQNHAVRPSEFEPGRIRLTVPMRAYARAWVLAGATDSPTRAPILTVRFYKPMTDWATDAAVTVPSLTAEAGGTNARPIRVKTTTGKSVNLWLIPIELNTAQLVAEFRNPTASLELTKAIQPNLAYPDPCNYSYQPAGLPSSVQLYALTFEEAPVLALATSDIKGGVYTDPEKPNWRVTIRNQSARDLPVALELAVIDPYGKTVPLKKTLTLKPGEEQTPSFPIKPAVYGLHTVRTTVSAGSWSQSRDGAFLALPAISRKATPLNSPWGVWSWNGVHGTNPDREETARLLRALGAINHFPLATGRYGNEDSQNEFRSKWGLGPTHLRLVPRQVPAWAGKAPLDPAEYEAYKEEKGKETKAFVDKYPDFQYVNCFAENSISLRLTHGIAPGALGQPWFTYEAYEEQRIRQLLNAANAAAEGVKKYAPGVKFLFGHGAPNFAVPFFREKDWNPDLFAGFGMDMPQFERMPERQPRATEPSLLYFLQKELKERGLEKKEIVHLESYYPSGHELALGLRGQADNIVRTAVLSMALGTTKFMHAWCLQDPSDRWGSQHYSGSGLIGREPEAMPKPAAAAYATMSRVLDLAKYDGWLETGSRSAFCVRFKDEDRLVYAVWTYHGSRPLEIVSGSETVRLVKIDESGNEFPLPLVQGKASVTLTPTVLWIVARGGEIKSALAGTTTHTSAPALGTRSLVLDDFEKGNWSYHANSYDRYASNNWDMVREPVRMAQEFVKSEERTSTVWRVTMTERPAGKPCVGFYGVFTPPKPILIPGKAKALGLYGKGHSQWFRLIYEVVDAKGEVWLSCGQKNAWNSDDIKSWSYFNHDGWRYMEFPLPATFPGDNSRDKSCYSWGGSDDGIVDLPLTLTRVMVEMRTDIIYVNQMVPVEDLSVEMDDLVAVYDDPENMTDKPVKLQVAAQDAWRPILTASVLPNPIKTLSESSSGQVAVIEKIYPPETMASGDQVFVKIKSVEGAKKYTVYVSAYPDGTGAKPAPSKADEKEPSLLFVKGLQPAIPMYFYATYTDKDGTESKPSDARKTVLRDEFPFK